MKPKEVVGAQEVTNSDGGMGLASSSGKGGGESGTRKSCSSSSSSLSSGAAARTFPLLISSVFRALLTLQQLTGERCPSHASSYSSTSPLGTASGTPMGFCASSSRRSAAVVSLDSLPMNWCQTEYTKSFWSLPYVWQSLSTSHPILTGPQLWTSSSFHRSLHSLIYALSSR